MVEEVGFYESQGRTEYVRAGQYTTCPKDFRSAWPLCGDLTLDESHISRQTSFQVKRLADRHDQVSNNPGASNLYGVHKVAEALKQEMIRPGPDPNSVTTFGSQDPLAMGLEGCGFHISISSDWVNIKQ